MKYGRWKREAKRLQREYARLKARPVNAKAFFPFDYTEGDDATEPLQHAVNHMVIAGGGWVSVPAGTYRFKGRGLFKPDGVGVTGEAG